MTDKDVIRIRKELDLTQEKFAELVGLDRKTICIYESGKRSIPKSKQKLLLSLSENIIKKKDESLHIRNSISELQKSLLEFKQYYQLENEKMNTKINRIKTILLDTP